MMRKSVVVGFIASAGLLGSCSSGLGVEEACGELESYRSEGLDLVDGMASHSGQWDQVNQYGERLEELGYEIGSLNIADEELAETASDMGTHLVEMGEFFSVAKPGVDTGAVRESLASWDISVSKFQRLCST